MRLIKILNENRLYHEHEKEIKDFINSFIISRGYSSIEDFKNQKPDSYNFINNKLIKILNKELGKPLILLDPNMSFENEFDTKDYSAKTLFGLNMQEVERKLEHILDWIAVDENNKNLVGFNSLKHLEKAADAFFKTANKHSQKNEDFDNLIPILELDDGYTFYKLDSSICRTREGALMGHCVGRGGYEGSDVEIFSLRDYKNNPHATIEARNNHIRQIKGKQNTSVVKKYWPYVEKFLNHMLEKNYTISDNDLDNIGLMKFDNKIIKISDFYDLYVKNEIEKIKTGVSLIKEPTSISRYVTTDDLLIVDKKSNDDYKIVGKIDLDGNRIKDIYNPDSNSKIEKKYLTKIAEDLFSENNFFDLDENSIFSLDDLPEDIKDNLSPLNFGLKYMTDLQQKNLYGDNFVRDVATFLKEFEDYTFDVSVDGNYLIVFDGRIDNLIKYHTDDIIKSMYNYIDGSYSIDISVHYSEIDSFVDSLPVKIEEKLINAVKSSLNDDYDNDESLMYNIKNKKDENSDIEELYDTIRDAVYHGYTSGTEQEIYDDLKDSIKSLETVESMSLTLINLEDDSIAPEQDISIGIAATDLVDIIKEDKYDSYEISRYLDEFINGFEILPSRSLRRNADYRYLNFDEEVARQFLIDNM